MPGSYTRSMKIAISIPDPLYQEAEQLAGVLRISRSRLYADALRQYLRSYKNEHVRETLDQIYTEHDSAVPPDIALAQSLALGRESW